MANPVFASIVVMPQVTLPNAGTVYNFDYDLGRDGIVGIKTGFGLRGGRMLSVLVEPKGRRQAAAGRGRRPRATDFEPHNRGTRRGEDSRHRGSPRSSLSAGGPERHGGRPCGRAVVQLRRCEHPRRSIGFRLVGAAIRGEARAERHRSRACVVGISPRNTGPRSPWEAREHSSCDGRKLDRTF